ncbi:DUF2339 domain-containing protein [Pedobacter sp. UC225_65]|uniref:DUF2339 domain-containing protein n=1 Tax=Pedobacter sp. UC225_65 TaxID=3350173 RepID=UPI00366F13CB
MDKKEEQLNLLLLKIENLLLRQQDFEAEIKHLREEIRQIRSSSGSDAPIFTEKSIQQPTFLPKNTPPSFAKPIQPKPFAQPSFTDKFKRENLGKSDFEKFIGENLINKIGILILIIGVAIGAKYAIDHEMISPLTRIILGYAMGTGLMAFAIKLKTKYESFSAVLLSGAIAILYFITYAAYAYYALIPQFLTFGLMVVFTSFTVVAAIKYNQQVIAHIGLVGAYAVPFLLSDGSGKVVILFSYMAIINTGILVLAFKKYWKSLFYSSFTLSWIIFLAWRIPLEAHAGYFNISMLFSGIFFITFYITNLAYKVIKKEQFQIIDIIILLLNSFIFYGIGYYALLQNPKATELLGLFTLGNAIIHFVVSLIIYKRKLADKNLFYFILAMVITFITMAVPVQLNGNWVTIFWAIEAFILFYLGRTKHIAIYEKLSFPLIFLAFFSLLQDWALRSSEFSYLNDYTPHQAFFNVGFLSSCLCIASFLGMFLINRQAKEESIAGTTRSVRQVMTYCIPTILIITVYYTFRIEIANIFQDAYENTKINTTPSLKVGNYAYNENYRLFKTTWVYCYTLFFAAVLTYFNLQKIKSKELAVTNLIINVLVILAFLTQGLYVLSELREAYILQSDKYFSSSMTNIGIRYIALAFFAGLIIVCYQLSKSDLFKLKFRTAFDYLLYIAILWVLSSELLQLLQLNGLENGYKLGLSILWGVYSLFLISMGLWKNKKYLRVGAIILFGITLVKLCFYDLSSLGTISRTIVFISLGILLLIISFLYNKYKHLINDDVKAKN